MITDFIGSDAAFRLDESTKPKAIDKRQADLTRRLMTIAIRACADGDARRGRKRRGNPKDLYEIWYVGHRATRQLHVSGIFPPGTASYIFCSSWQSVTERFGRRCLTSETTCR